MPFSEKLVHYAIICLAAISLAGLLVLRYRISRRRTKPGKIVFAIAGLLFILFAAAFFEPALKIAILPLQIIFIFFLFRNAFFIKKTSSQHHTAKSQPGFESLQKEIEYRLTIEDKIIAKHKQLEWAEKTAQICYGSWDISTDTLTFSDGGNNIFGMSSAHNHPFAALIEMTEPEDRYRFDNVKEKVLSKARIVPFLFRINLNGHTKHIRVIGEAYVEEENNVLLFRGTFQDVTEQQLFIKRIEDKNTALREIAWTQSHEVRGPLASILGVVGLLNEQNISAPKEKMNNETLELLGWLEEAALQLDHVVKNVVTKSTSTGD